MGKTVLVLGGSLGGLAVTHRLLKYTRQNEKDLKVILVTRNSHFYWNLASVRAVIPGVVEDDEILAPIESGLEQYPPESVEFILGSANAIDATSRTVRVAVAAGDGEEQRSLGYDYLVLATGADGLDPAMPWKAAGSHRECLSSLHGTAARIGAAAHVVVAGGGPTGVELAAEIRDAFPHTPVVLLSGSDRLVGGDSSAGAVERELLRLGVVVRKGVRAESAEPLPDGKTLVRLADGDTITTDLYLPTMGQRPNTGFMPPGFANEHGYVDVDEQLRVKAAQGTWAVGDVISKPRASFINTEAQAACVVKNIELAIQGKEQQHFKGPPVDVFICSIGRGRGAGRVGYVPVPSFFVWAVKGRTLGLERTPKYADGSMW